MLKKHKNRIFEQIKTDGFNPNDFEFVYVKDNLDRILVNDSKLWFGFEMQPESFEHFRYSYSFFTPQTNATGSAKTDSFESILKTFSNWMNSQVSQFISERESDDLFEIFKKGNEFDFNNFDSEINQMFEKSDIEFIKVKLLQLDSFIKDSFVTNNEQHLKIEAAISYLSKTVSDRSKFDWRGILFSTILSIITTLTLDTQKGIELWNYTVELFKQIKLLSK